MRLCWARHIMTKEKILLWHLDVSNSDCVRIKFRIFSLCVTGCTTPVIVKSWDKFFPNVICESESVLLTSKMIYTAEHVGWVCVNLFIGKYGIQHPIVLSKVFCSVHRRALQSTFGISITYIKVITRVQTDIYTCTLIQCICCLFAVFLHFAFHAGGWMDDTRTFFW